MFLPARKIGTVRSTNRCHVLFEASLATVQFCLGFQELACLETVVSVVQFAVFCILDTADSQDNLSNSRNIRSRSPIIDVFYNIPHQFQTRIPPT